MRPCGYELFAPRTISTPSTKRADSPVARSSKAISPVVNAWNCPDQRAALDCDAPGKMKLGVLEKRALICVVTYSASGTRQVAISAGHGKPLLATAALVAASHSKAGGPFQISTRTGGTAGLAEFSRVVVPPAKREGGGQRLEWRDRLVAAPLQGGAGARVQP